MNREDKIASIISMFPTIHGKCAMEVISVDLYKLNDFQVDVLYSVIKKCNVTFHTEKTKYDRDNYVFEGGVFMRRIEGGYYVSLVRKSGLDNLLHELGHVVFDYYSEIICEECCETFGHSLSFLLEKDLEQNQKETVHYMTADIRKRIENRFGEHSFDLIEDNLIRHSTVITLDRTVVLEYDKNTKDNYYFESEQEIFDDLYKCGYVEDVITKLGPIVDGFFGGFLASYEFLCKNEILEDLFYSIFDPIIFGCDSTHNPYYYTSRGNLDDEFFANMFSAFVLNTFFAEDMEPFLKEHFRFSIGAFTNSFNAIIKELNLVCS